MQTDYSLKITLNEHRTNLSQNSDCYIYDIFYDTERIINTFVPHIKKAGFSGISFKKNYDLLKSIIFSFFEMQENRPFFHVEGTELPLCWNSPKDWDKNYIKYEWGHIHSINQNQKNAHSIKNLGLYSARCNQHIQSSLDVQELMIYGGILATRISSVLTKRRFLFESEKWIKIETELNQYQ